MGGAVLLLLLGGEGEAYLVSGPICVKTSATYQNGSTAASTYQNGSQESATYQNGSIAGATNCVN